MNFKTLVTAASIAMAMGITPLHAGWQGGKWGSTSSATSVQDSTPLSEEEAETLQFMREEEKMARDVYLTLFDEWGLSIFENISSSEQRHMNAMKTQLDNHGIEDPVTDDTVGYFNNELLGQMYQDLVSQGMQSREQALRAGAYIEEVDILDLEEAIAGSGHDDVTQAYENLMRGSRNHLRAFVRQLESMGIVYKAEVMDPDKLDAIVDSPMERGSRKGRSGKRKGR